MPRHIRPWAACALAALALFGCAKKNRVVDPSFNAPEGTFSSDLELITYLDQPTYKIAMVDRGQAGKVDIVPEIENSDTIAADPNGALQIAPVREYPAGTVRGLIINRSSAEGVEVFRSEPNGAVRKLFDYPLQPVRRWIDGQTEIYEFVDTDVKRAIGSTYVVRGQIGGTAGSFSPLSNPSRVQNIPLRDIRYTGWRDGRVPIGNTNPPPAEANFKMAWAAVPNAARYLVQVFEYQPTAFDLPAQLRSGVPAPFLTEAARDIFVASVPPQDTIYKVGDALPGVRIYTNRQTQLGVEYFVRICALDANQQMIGLTVGPTVTKFRDLLLLTDVRDYFANFTDPEAVALSPTGYLFYTRSAVRVEPRNVPPAAPLASGRPRP